MTTEEAGLVRLEDIDGGVYDCNALDSYPDQMVRCGRRAVAWWRIRDEGTQPVCSTHDRQLTKEAERG
jgi:hypothetical protein